MREVVLRFHYQPAYWAGILGVLMVVAGFAVMALGWRGAAALDMVPLQLSYALSGGIGGLALVAFGAVILAVQEERRLAARERAELASALSVSISTLTTVAARQADQAEAVTGRSS